MDGTRTQWNVTKDFYMGLDVMYAKLNSAARLGSAAIGGATNVSDVGQLAVPIPRPPGFLSLIASQRFEKATALGGKLPGVFFAIGSRRPREGGNGDRRKSSPGHHRGDAPYTALPKCNAASATALSLYFVVFV